MKTDSLPPGVHHAIRFAFFNAVSFQIFLGPPMVLYAKSLGASATMLGFIASLCPLLTISQIPATHFIPRFGYRRFFLAGWMARNICVFVAVLVPLLGFIKAEWKLATMIAVQVVFNFLRGAVSSAWLPWITELLPESHHARYLAREQRGAQIGCLLALTLSALLLKRESTPLEFSAVFLISAIGGAASLFMLNRVPDVPLHRVQASGTPVPWLAIVTFPPFARLVAFNLVFLFATGSLSVFTVSFMKARIGLGENVILSLTAMTFLCGAAALPFTGRWMDRLGAKRILQTSLIGIALCVLLWLGLASSLLQHFGWVLVIHALGGICSSTLNIANSRLQMSTMPPMGRSHFFAFFSVITNLFLGITPIAWGICIDRFHDLQSHAWGIDWNRFSLYFAGISLMTLLAVAATQLLPHHAEPTEETETSATPAPGTPSC